MKYSFASVSCCALAYRGIDSAHPWALPLRGSLRLSGSAILPIRRTRGGSHPPSPPETQNAPFGAFANLAERGSAQPLVVVVRLRPEAMMAKA